MLGKQGGSEVELCRVSDYAAEYPDEKRLHPQISPSAIETSENGVEET